MAAQVNPRGEGRWGKERHAIGSGDFCLYEKIPNKYLSNLGISKTQMFSIECDVVKRARRIAHPKIFGSEGSLVWLPLLQTELQYTTTASQQKCLSHLIFKIY